MIHGISREARQYAVRELFRRAAVREAFFNSWKIEVQTGWTTVHLPNGTGKFLKFRNGMLPEPRPDQRNYEVARAAWSFTPPEQLRRLVPYFVVPFSNQSPSQITPLFRRVDGGVECDFDLPLSTLLTLSRFEEYSSSVRDEHDRFSASQSLAFREGFLTRPVIDELGLGVEQALSYLLPGWQPEERKLSVKLSHDIDLTGIPSSFRTTIAHTIRRGKPSATLRDLAAKITRLKPTYLDLTRKIVQLSIERDLDSAVYWKAGPPGAHDTGYDPHATRIQEVILWLKDRGVECGVHPGYETFDRPDLLQSEVRIVREAVGERLIGGRQHYLRWKPETWLDWEACELAYDSTVGFPDHVGFRAGTCFPYRPWVLSANREVQLLEIPLIMMDCTPVAYMGLSLQKSLELMDVCLSRCRLVGGTFTVLWHNSTLIDRGYGNLYQEILERLSGSGPFDWRAARLGWRSNSLAAEPREVVSVSPKA